MLEKRKCEYISITITSDSPVYTAPWQLNILSYIAAIGSDVSHFAIVEKIYRAKSANCYQKYQFILFEPTYLLSFSSFT